ncbi:MAG: RHH-type transcriptional regulator, proline utilization regulon repressor / proline dehydrogenase [Acidimicrobiaceae bacterium]|nr:RHH-type transcriptional regulator, proline utilization regulon repressor / proline dehydrogenase [Acidimicrobiaceae bacterium]
MARTSEAIDGDVTALATRIAELGEGEKANVYRMSWWSDRMLGWAMSHPSFKTQLFRFVDVFPATHSDAEVLRHVREYFDGADVPRALDLGVGLADHVPGGGSITATVARRNIRRMAEQFIVGATPAEAVDRLHQLWRAGSGFVVDLLGEKTVTDAEADRYAERVSTLVSTLVRASAGWAPDDHLERDDRGRLPRVQVSIKPTALATHYGPLTRSDGLASAKGRLRPLLKDCADQGVFVWFDMEQYDAKDLTLQLFRDLMDEPELSELDAGCVIQAYTRDSREDLADLCAWSSARVRDGQAPVGVRLVKGAYWDAETIEAEAAGWPSPLYSQKAETDANYERLTAMLLSQIGAVRPAFASHNLRSLAHAVVLARSLGIPDSAYELQMLYGMAEPIQAAIRRLGLRLRVYAPVGELVPGMAYLVRRLLENTSNESFVRHRFAEGREVAELVAPPGVAWDSLPGVAGVARRGATDPSDPGEYRPEPPAEWRRAGARASMAAAVTRVVRPESASGALGLDVPAVIGGRAVATAEGIVSVDPARPSAVVATSAACGASEADEAVASCLAAGNGWRSTPVAGRAAVLFRAAEWMRARRPDLAALEVFEAGKPWAEADADVCEAIDFLEYYGRQMRMLDMGAGRHGVQSPPGEVNTLHYQPRGVAAVIAPWNFPLAIATGMVSAALVAGNAVCFKPAEQTPAIGATLVDALTAAGLPPGVLAFLPGRGEEVGARLVAHPDVSLIAFTGSKAVGLAINEAASRVVPGQRQVKRVIAEMGGKNPLIVDTDADFDQAVPIIVGSAFGFSGQKCSALSRLIVVGDGHDELVARLVGAAAVLRIGQPSSMGTDIGPLIDAEAHAKVMGYLPVAQDEGSVVLQRDDVPEEGWFVGPTIVADVPPGGRLATEEIFGPVLSVFRAGDIDEALALANDTDYALTAGILSRSPATIRRATAELRAGNVYVNRGITGAVVGRQPFGGLGLSGVGSKAGGPDYLLSFLEPRVVSENTLRQGFAATSE